MWRDFAAKRLAVLWAFAILVVYFVSLGEWLRPGVIKWALPFPGATTAPDLLIFGGGVGKLLLALGVLLAAGHGAGIAAARFLRTVPGPAGRTFPLGRTIPLGWAMAGFLFLGLGLAGLWFGAVIAVAVAVLVGLSLRHRRRTWWPAEEPGAHWRRVGFALPAALVAWMGLLMTLAPEVFQDAMRYHLFFPRRFVLEHKFFFVDGYFYWSYMGLLHALYGAALAAGGELAAKGVNVVFGLFSLAALVRIMRLSGLADRDRALALGLTVTAPGFLLITGSAFAEHATALYVLLAVETVCGGGGRGAARLREIAVMLSLAFAVKYTAVFGMAGCAVMMFAGGEREEWAGFLRRWRGRIAVLAAGVCVPWLAMRWFWTRDPLSPLFARLGLGSLDASSSWALSAFYSFAREAHESWLLSPAELLKYPIIFAGAHGGYWEHPGPAIPALLLVAVFLFGRSAAPVQRILLFAGGSFGAWMIFCGGISPHYVIALAGLWTGACVGALGAVEGGSAGLLRNLLSLCVFYQALVALVAVLIGWGPRDIVFGIVTEDYYLGNGLEPLRVHYPLRKEIERRLPGRGTVYVYGDDTSYYLAGRVYVDYELGSDPLLWRLAAASSDPAHLRRKVRQRGWTHVLYSARWPDVLGADGKLHFRHEARTLMLVQDFWRLYARQVLAGETSVRDRPKASFLFAIGESADASGFDPDPNSRWPFLPGAEALVWEGDRALEAGGIGRARTAYTEKLMAYPGFALLHDRMARAALSSGDRRSARGHLEAAKGLGWNSRRLRERAGAGRRKGESGASGLPRS